jgi:hypothetical protein
MCMYIHALYSKIYCCKGLALGPVK